MRTVYCKPIDQQVSVLGFGSASLGSRISASQGEQALQLAFDNGVTWYDVAPPYGDGQAEGILGGFLTGKRDQVAICTKVGIGRPTISRPKALLRLLARPVVKALPQLRGRISGLRGAAQRVPISADTIEDSVVQSLRALRTDYVDVLALHEPTPAEVADPHIQGTLQRMVKKGYARAISVAGPMPSIQAAGATPGILVIQTSDNPFEHARCRLPVDGLFPITHSVFGSGALERFSAFLEAYPEACSRLVSIASTPAPSDMLLDLAFAKNPSGLVLASMFSPRHVQANCAHAAKAPNFALLEAFEAEIAMAQT